MLCDEQGFSVRSPPLGPILFPFHVHQPLFWMNRPLDVCVEVLFRFQN